MNIKKRIPKFISLLLSFTIAFGNVIPAYAMENTNSDSATVIDGEDIRVDERNLEDITVTYKQASSFFVTIPKTIVLDGWKQSTYSVKVSGDIDAEQCVYVAPVDMIDETGSIDFYMKDQASENAKDDVVASVTHNKFHWNSAEVAAGHKQADNLVEAPDLTAGAWRGIFQMEIKLETHVTHTHNYVETITKEPTCTEAGEKKYTCDCGDSYTKVIPAKGHNFIDGECKHCHEKDPNYHKHSYTETITKQPTCTEAGGKTYICDCGDSYTEEIPATGHHYGDDDKCTGCGELNPDHRHNYTATITKEPTCTEAGEKTYTCGCGDSYTEEIPAKGHNYVDGTCINCGKTSLYEVAPETAYSNWDYTLDEENNIITLNYYVGSESDVIVYANYIIDGKSYKTQIASNTDDATNATPYMFNGNPQTNCKNIKSIIFSDSIDTSNVTNMSFMFYECQSLIELGISNFNTSKVADMQYMFCNLQHLTSLDLSSFDTSNVTNMRSMFYQCLLLENLNIGNFDTSKVTDMQYMFFNCRALTSLDLSNFNTNNVTNMDTMFGGCYVLTSLNISSFDTSNVTNMRNMFSLCKSLTSLDLSNFNTGNVTNMEYMFYQCIALESLNVSRFDTSKVTNMMSMFCDNWKVTYLDVSGFDTSKTTDMRSMFFNCRALTELDLSNFNTSNVTMMSNMFYSCYSLTSLDLSNFDTSNVTNMNGMFKSCRALTNLDISSFDTKKVTDMREMFRYNSNLKAIYVDRNKWSTSLAASTKCPYGSQTQIGTYNMFSGCGTSSVTYRSI